ncbi:MAG TPA: carboxylating nicotinate-nucleotide diphosphorylase [Candidatus Acidoferrales bacterium]|nr:carboxylating nicotinate-nucleotide diphosphorylase [Candidatus Acidoferrales bacterium]
MPRRIVEERLKEILAEDIGEGDVTAAAIIPANISVKAEVIAKAEGIIAGLEEAAILAESMGLKVETKAVDGSKVKNKQVLMTISGDAQTILSVERTLLNLLSRMSGIATKTNVLTEQLEKAKVKARIAATRKSAPGLLYFDKKAVVLGGGDPHRLHLDDMVLIKDNHLAIVGSAEEAVKKAKANTSFSKKIEVEVTSAHDALKAAKAGADIIMLDNFSPKQAKEAGEQLRKAGFANVLLEVSGGITSETLLEYASAQVDIISLGELTHSVKALDISLEIVKA